MSAVTSWERVAFGVSALVVVSSMLLSPPVVRAVDPVLAVAFNHANGMVGDLGIPPTNQWSREIAGTSDPWGRAWTHATSWGSTQSEFSVGPDGVDDDGYGDDVTLGDVRAHPLSGLMPRANLRWPRLSLASAGVLLALWTRITRDTLRRPRDRLVVELCSAAWIASAPTSAGSLWMILSPRFFGSSDALGVVQLPAPIAILLSWGLLCFLIALAWRLSRPHPTEALPT